jgi:hypothetical protein
MRRLTKIRMVFVGLYKVFSLIAVGFRGIAKILLMGKDMGQRNVGACDI